MPGPSHRCHYCGNENPSNSKYCSECGEATRVTCRDCGCDAPPSSNFCPNCGSRLTTEVPQPTLRHLLPEKGEHRQVTILFCDMVDSTRLVQNIGAENYRELIREYRELCIDSINQFGGYVSRFFGDGFLAIYGYPEAHEDDPPRSVQTAFGIIEQTREKNFELREGESARIQVRIGIATGPVISEELRVDESRRDIHVVGETPNLASRIQAIAEPNTVATNDLTRRLIQREFKTESIGVFNLKGFSQPIELFKVFPEPTSSRRWIASSKSHYTTLVGRAIEFDQLCQSWGKVDAKGGHAVLIQGDAGIGKSRLVRELRLHLQSEDHCWLECRGSAIYSRSALHPIIEMFGYLCGLDANDALATRREKLLAKFPEFEDDEHGLDTLIDFLGHDKESGVESAPHRDQPTNALISMLRLSAAKSKLVFVIEDLHWVDPSTKKLLNLLIEQIPTLPILIVATARPEFTADWTNSADVTEISPGYLRPFEVESMIIGLSKEVPITPNIRTKLAYKTDGVPLYVEELTRSVVEAYLRAKSWNLNQFDKNEPLIPETLRDSLMGRLDKLSSSKFIAQIGSVFGRTFTFAQIDAATEVDPNTLTMHLRILVDADILRQRGDFPNANFMFKHSLLQNIAYDSILVSNRTLYHFRIAKIFSDIFSEVDDANPEIVARHFVLAGKGAESLDRWCRAATLALRRGTGLEAIEHCREGLRQLSTIDDDASRANYELSLQTSLGASLSACYGFAMPEVRKAYDRAWAIAETLELKTAHRFAILQGIHQVRLIGDSVTEAKEVGQQLVAVANGEIERYERRGEANRCLGWTLFCHGELEKAKEALELGLTLYDRAKMEEVTRFVVTDAGGVGLANLSWIHWFLGEYDEAVARSAQSIEHAREIDHSFTIAYNLCIAGALETFREDPVSTGSYASEALKLATTQDLNYWKSWSTCLLGWSKFRQGERLEGRDQIGSGLSSYRLYQSTLLEPHLLLLLADCELVDGDLDSAEASLARALETTETYQINCFQAEIFRKKAELSFARSDVDAGRAHCRESIRIARAQGARWIEARSTTLLAEHAAN